MSVYERKIRILIKKNEKKKELILSDDNNHGSPPESIRIDQSDDKAATSQSLQGIRHAVHVTAVMGMQTQRDAFVTTVAKFTYLHCAADIKQKNVDAVKVISLQTLFYMCLNNIYIFSPTPNDMSLCNINMEDVVIIIT